MKDAMYNAALLHFQSKREEALASIEIYLKNPVGVGDHSSFLDDIKKLTISLSEAEECIGVLEKYHSRLIGENILK